MCNSREFIEQIKAVYVSEVASFIVKEEKTMTLFSGMQGNTVVIATRMISNSKALVYLITRARRGRVPYFQLPCRCRPPIHPNISNPDLARSSWGRLGSTQDLRDGQACCALPCLGRFPERNRSIAPKHATYRPRCRQRSYLWLV